MQRPSGAERLGGRRAKLGVELGGQAGLAMVPSSPRSRRPLEGQQGGLELTPWKGPLSWLWLPRRGTVSFPSCSHKLFRGSQASRTLHVGVPATLAPLWNSAAFVSLPTQTLAEGLWSPVALRCRQKVVH